jgi:hypothetical protein
MGGAAGVSLSESVERAARKVPRFTASSLLFRSIINEIYARGFYLIGTEFNVP